MSRNKKNSLPMYGVGPLFVAVIIAITLVGVLLHYFKLLDSGVFPQLKIPFIIIGVLLIIGGILIWCLAVFKAKIDKGIEANKLVTTGIYAWCRNPIYTAFMMFCTSACLFTFNIYLLILPFVYWILLWLFMKNTEEKWLYNVFGEDYISYCKKVNRCIPWIPKG